MSNVTKVQLTKRAYPSAKAGSTLAPGVYEVSFFKPGELDFLRKLNAIRDIETPKSPKSSRTKSKPKSSEVQAKELPFITEEEN